MPFSLEKTPVDLQDTPIENLFLDLYMPIAPGDYVKVYLLGYRYAQLAVEGKRFSSQTIAENLNLEVDEVYQAWQYWEEKKLIRRIPDQALPGEEYGIEFMSLKTLHFTHATPVTLPETPGASEPVSYTATPGDLLEVHEKESFQQFFKSIDQLLQRPLVPNEEMQILEWLQHYKITREVVLLAFRYAVLQKEIRSVPYVAGVVRNWADEGLITPEKVQLFLERQQLRYRHYDSIFKALGFHGRLPSEAEIHLMDQWLDQFHFSLEMILKACALSAGTSKPSVRYINGILERWHKEGLQTPDAVDRYEALRKEKREKTGSRGAASSKPIKKTSFHLSESRFKDYTNEDLEKILQGRKRRPRKEDDQ